ncbi:DsbA family oxidoreductase [Caenispirillum bisanense]|uniref:Predicted dithiol-disulfide isomerase, DsbA family n=1 Tax=Caenispirillum bisanense TaxID=414052 RepID=A0A286GF89_9PROT|nr:DsbA family oxidoreductase [Caenispirillum bisanense]SOD94168.1 Predicted dithiol-disulfide isomerase, DsbA family [Caenispirillum bisanense]
MRISIVFDTVCPWCFIGKRRVERALRSRPEVRPEFGWQPFLLNPELPPEGTERSLYLERKFGGRQRVDRMYDALAAAGRVEGIDFSFDRIRRTPNSLNSHRLIQMTPAAVQPRLVDALFVAYFTHGIDIGDPAELAAVAAAHGLDGDDVFRRLRSESGANSVYAANARSHRMGINGVPCFVFGDRFSMAGAQEVEVLVRMIDMAAETDALAPVSQL